MHTIQVELEEELIAKLAMYQIELAELLELGLQVWQEQEFQKRLAQRNNLVRALERSGKIRAPQPYTEKDSYARHAPISVRGQDVSEIVIEQRGVL